MYYSNINVNLNNFKEISLNDIKKIILLDRIDKKYIFNIVLLPQLLNKVKENYFILQANNTKLLTYQTYYYDTNNLLMYYDHHNKKPNRLKIRIREYVDTNTFYVEVKNKIKGYITSKKRRPIDSPTLSAKLNNFIETYSPFKINEIKPTVNNSFKRIFLVEKNFNERITIDFDLKFYYNNINYSLNNIVITEIKRDKSKINSLLSNILKEYQIRPTSFSKYCMGMIFTQQTSKYNSFKKTILLINKLQNYYGLYNN